MIVEGQVVVSPVPETGIPLTYTLEDPLAMDPLPPSSQPTVSPTLATGILFAYTLKDPLFIGRFSLVLSPILETGLILSSYPPCIITGTISSGESILDKVLKALLTSSLPMASTTALIHGFVTTDNVKARA